MALDKRVLWAWLGLWLAWTALLNPTWVSSSVNAFSALSSWIATWTKALVSNILWAEWVAKVWAMAPFAAPVIGWLVWYKIAWGLWIENKLWKTAIWITWAWAWASLLGTWALAWSFAPLLLWAGWIYAGYKGLSWTFGKLKWATSA